MAYIKTVWSTGDTITASLANHWESQYDEVKAELEKTGGASAIKPDWSNINNKPATYPPSAHTHDDRYYTESEADLRFETPAGAQAKVDTHAAQTSTHGATSAATANRIILRDASGRAKVAAPAASDDIARKAEVDAKVTGPASAVNENIAIFDGTTGKLVKDSGKKSSDFMSSNKIYGNASYTDSIAASGTLTKSIPLGGSYKHGIAVLHSGTSSLSPYGVIIFFGTGPQNTLVVGYYENGTDDVGSAWSRRQAGYVTTSQGYSAGYLATGNAKIRTVDFYIDGSNLKIVFNNIDPSNAQSLGCSLDWEVW